MMSTIKKYGKKYWGWCIPLAIVLFVASSVQSCLNTMVKYGDGAAAWTIMREDDHFKVTVQMPNPGLATPTFTAVKTVKTVAEGELFAHNIANANRASVAGIDLAKEYLNPGQDKPCIYDGPPGPIFNLGSGWHTTLAVRSYGLKPFRYQWRRNGVVVSDVSDNSNLNLTGGPGVSGLYDCIVSNYAGVDTSRVVSVVTQ